MHACSSNRECSVQEAVYHCLQELWLQNDFPGTVCASTNIPEKHFRSLRSQKEISEGAVPDDFNNIFKKMCLTDM